MNQDVKFNPRLQSSKDETGDIAKSSFEQLILCAVMQFTCNICVLQKKKLPFHFHVIF